MTRLGWWHCLAGASGDMSLGAIVDAGVGIDVLQAAIDAIGVEPIRLTARDVVRQGTAATKVDVDAPRSSVVRTWANVRGLLEGAALDEAVRATALDAFARLAVAEARVHRTTPEQVHFHEVGGLDAIADIVGTAAGLAALRLDRVVASIVTVGYGMARGEHGLIPVPGPAVLALLGDAGAPIQSGPAAYEMCTPTGAALLAATVRSWGPLPPMRVETVGTGAGGRDLDEVPNILRLVVGESVEPHGAPGGAGGADTDDAAGALVIETNVDDLDPRLWPAVLARLLDAGASDAWLTPILMKKGRPAHTLHVLVGDAAADAVRRVIFTETSTIGLREVRFAKRALDRAVMTVQVDGVDIRIKTAHLDGTVVNAQPEYDDVVAAAARLGRPVKAVLAAASAAAHEAGLAP